MIRTNVIEPGSIVEFIMEGHCEVEEVIDVIRNNYNNISDGVMWNLTGGTIVEVNTHNMIRIAQAVKKHARHKKTAYVGLDDLEYGLLRMYEAHAKFESVQPEMQVFRDRDKALQWLQEIN